MNLAMIHCCVTPCRPIPMQLERDNLCYNSTFYGKMSHSTVTFHHQESGRHTEIHTSTFLHPNIRA